MTLMEKGKQVVVGGVVSALCATGMVLGLGIGSAEAVSGTCSATKQKDEVFGPDQYRVRAWCSSLSGDAKARGNLNRNNQVDEHTAWFTTLNKYYYGSWDDCLWSCSANYQISHV